MTPGIGKLGTVWNTDDIWIRRTFNPGALTAAQISRLVVRDYHDEDIEVYINGVLAYSAPGYIGSYEYRPINKEAKAVIRPNTRKHGRRALPPRRRADSTSMWDSPRRFPESRSLVKKEKPLS